MMRNIVKIFKIFVCIITCLVQYDNLYAKTFPEGLEPIDVLFHGSTNANIKILEPRSNSSRDISEGKVIFATPSLKLASCYLFKWDDSWVHQFVSSKNGDRSDIIMVIGDKAKFEKEDHGGTIYVLPIQGFTFDENKGMGIYEWTNKSSVKPLLEINFSSSIDAMKRLGVIVYFITKDQFKDYLSLSYQDQEKFLFNLSKQKDE